MILEADGVKHGINFSAIVKNIAAQEPFPDLQDRLVGFAEITERIALERKSIMVGHIFDDCFSRFIFIFVLHCTPTSLGMR